jgi:hypothetical protein
VLAISATGETAADGTANVAFVNEQGGRLLPIGPTDGQET